MKTFIGVTFLFLAFGYYEMSGGADFVPQGPVAAAQASTVDQRQPAQPQLIARVETPTTAIVAPETAVATPVSLASATYEYPLGAAPRADQADYRGVTRSASASTATSAVASADLDLREITGDWVNMRSGPGTGHGVVDTLPRGSEARVLEADNGWVRIEMLDTGLTGWMSERLLAPIEG